MGPDVGMLSLHCVVPSLVSTLCSLLAASGRQGKTEGDNRVNIACYS